MREFLGIVRGAGPLELETAAGVEVLRAADLTLAISRHTRPAVSASHHADAYRRHGVAAIARRDEDAAVVLFDERSHTLILARDFVGMTPLYYATAHGGFAFGTRISRVVEALGSSRAPNRSALAGLLVMHGGPPPGQTLFENVSAVPAGHVLVRTNDTLRILAAELPPAPAQQWSFEDAATEFGHRLRAAVRQLMPDNERTAVFVSGGLDSSAVVCLAAELGDVVAVNYGIADDAGADETRYLDALRAHGIRVEHVSFLPTIDVASVERSVIGTEAPDFDMVPATLERATARCLELGARTVLNGTWGDQVLSPFPPAHHRVIAPWRVARLARAYQATMSDVLHADITRALRRHALRMRAPEWLLRRRRTRHIRGSLFDVLAAETNEVAPVERIRTYRDAITRNVFSPHGAQGIAETTKWSHAHGIDARLPFLERELIRLLLELPDEIAYHQHTLKPLLRVALKGVVPEIILQRSDKGDYTRAMQSNLLPRDVVLALLDDLRRPVQHGIMSRRNAEKTLARLHRHPNIWDGSSDLPLVLGLDLWLRLFFEK